MRKSACIKCGSRAIRRAPKGGWPGTHQIRIDTFTSALVECIVCVDCGYVELYVESESDREKMRRKFEPLDES